MRRVRLVGRCRARPLRGVFRQKHGHTRTGHHLSIHPFAKTDHSTVHLFATQHSGDFAEDAGASVGGRRGENAEQSGRGGGLHVPECRVRELCQYGPSAPHTTGAICSCQAHGGQAEDRQETFNHH